MSVFADNVQKLRVKHALSQRDLANKIGVSKSTVGNWESSNSLPDLDRLSVVARVLGVSVADLFKQDLDVDSLVPFIEVPVYGSIAAGKPIEMENSEFDFPAPYQIVSRYPKAFFLKVEGESMNKVLPNGSYAFVDPDQKEPFDNGAYAVCVNGYDATIKRVRKLANGFELAPDSTDPTYRAMVYDYGVDGTDQISIIGKIVWYCIPFDFEI